MSPMLTETDARKPAEAGLHSCDLTKHKKRNIQHIALNRDNDVSTSET
jgi:hypothetical protein